MILDTHKAIEKLISTGNNKENAETIVDIINSIDSSLATKSDIKEVESNIKEVRSEVRSSETSLRSEIVSLRSEISTIKWMVGIFGASTIMMIGFILTKL